MPKPTGPEGTFRAPLTRERVLQTALELADEAGIESLTMRRLGQALGVEAMSLYNHVTNKDAILDGIVERVLNEIDLPSNTEDWDAAVRRFAVSAHQALLRHPWACSLVMAPTSGDAARGARMRYIEWLLARLRDGGFTPELAYHAYHALDSHILGFTLWLLGHTVPAGDGERTMEAIVRDLSTGDHPYLAEHAQQHLSYGGDDHEFEFSLDLVIDGLKELRRAGPPSGGVPGLDER